MHKIKYYIKEQLKEISGIDFRRINDEDGDASNGLIFLLPNKEKAAQFRKAMNDEEVATACLYNGEPIYMIPQLFYQKTVDKNSFPFNQFDEKIEYTKDMCPNALDLMSRNALISLSRVYTEKDADDIIKAVRKVARNIL